MITSMVFRLPVIATANLQTLLPFLSAPGGLTPAVPPNFCNLNLSQQSHLINKMALISPDVSAHINWPKIELAQPPPSAPMEEEEDVAASTFSSKGVP